jgi:hypothetical protein
MLAASNKTKKIKDDLMATKKKPAKKAAKVQLKNLKPKKTAGLKAAMAAPNSVVCPKPSSSK